MIDEIKARAAHAISMEMDKLLEKVFVPEEAEKMEGMLLASAYTQELDPEETVHTYRRAFVEALDDYTPGDDWEPEALKTWVETRRRTLDAEEDDEDFLGNVERWVNTQTKRHKISAQ